MRSDSFQWLLTICTLFWGGAALLYFNETFRKFARSNLRTPILRAPKAPISPSTLGAYVNTHPRPRKLDYDIAKDFDTKVKRSESDWQWLYELSKAVGVETIRDLDKLGKKHYQIARLLAHSFQLHNAIPSAQGVRLVLDIKAMNELGLDGFISMLGTLKLTSADPGYARELWEDYQRIVKHDAQQIR